MPDKEIICIQVSVFRSLIDEAVLRISEKFSLPSANQWVGTAEAMDILQIKSKTTLLQLRSEGKIRYSQPQHKVILYDRTSLVSYIEHHAKETF